MWQSSKFMRIGILLLAVALGLSVGTQGSVSARSVSQGVANSASAQAFEACSLPALMITAAKELWNAAVVQPQVSFRENLKKLYPIWEAEQNPRQLHKLLEEPNELLRQLLQLEPPRPALSPLGQAVLRMLPSVVECLPVTR